MGGSDPAIEEIQTLALTSWKADAFDVAAFGLILVFLWCIAR